MLGKAMRIATLCTLAFALCGGGRNAVEEKTSRTVPSKTSTKGSSTSRWFAKSLVLGASVHSTSALGPSVHAASGSRRPAGIPALAPLNAWGQDTINDRVVKPFRAKRAAKRIEAEKIADVLVAAENVRRFNKDDAPWKEWSPQLNALDGLQKKHLKKLWLGVMAEKGKADIIADVLVASERVYRSDEHDVPWEEWRPELENYLQGLKKKHLGRLWLGVMAEIITDLPVAAENVDRFKEHDVPLEEGRPKLENYLQGLKKKLILGVKDLQGLKKNPDGFDGL